MSKRLYIGLLSCLVGMTTTAQSPYKKFLRQIRSNKNNVPALEQAYADFQASGAAQDVKDKTQNRLADMLKKQGVQNPEQVAQQLQAPPVSKEPEPEKPKSAPEKPAPGQPKPQPVPKRPKQPMPEKAPEKPASQKPKPKPVPKVPKEPPAPTDAPPVPEEKNIPVPPLRPKTQQELDAEKKSGETSAQVVQGYINNIKSLIAEFGTMEEKSVDSVEKQIRQDMDAYEATYQSISDKSDVTKPDSLLDDVVVVQVKEKMTDIQARPVDRGGLLYKEEKESIAKLMELLSRLSPEQKSWKDYIVSADVSQNIKNAWNFLFGSKKSEQQEEVVLSADAGLNQENIDKLKNMDADQVTSILNDVDDQGDTIFDNWKTEITSDNTKKQSFQKSYNKMLQALQDKVDDSDKKRELIGHKLSTF